MSSSRPRSAPRYHHGDLRASVLREARVLLREEGASFSLRKLAERVGVSTPALYHPFRDKNALLCALAEGGFGALESVLDEATREDLDREARLRAIVQGYARFAAEEPETYDLMFGPALWRHGAPTPELREVSYASFKRYASVVRALVRAEGVDPRRGLRLAQTSWAMVHGLCRLRIDGIYVDDGDLEAMGEEAVSTLLARLRAIRGET